MTPSGQALGSTPDLQGCRALPLQGTQLRGFWARASEQRLPEPERSG